MSEFKPKTLIMSGYGINCERETAHAFDLVGAKTQIVHITDIIENKFLIDDCNILVFPGGFSMGDDTGSGLAYANIVRDNLSEQIEKFIERDTLAIGICNGFQIMSHLGFFPIGDKNYGTSKTALTFNSSARYRDLWVYLSNNQEYIESEDQEYVKSEELGTGCVWTKNISRLPLPIAHGEGRFYAPENIMEQLRSSNQIVLKYINKDGSKAIGDANPNGSLDDIAGICDPSGRFFGLMPHPERAIYSVQNEFFTLDREYRSRMDIDMPKFTDCLTIFDNAVNYF
ncbi:phosphoribosylformylglycinamidine synthase subunit PurQ [Candidatus Woesearchaeota archaeon]|nr:phosphoribosylformylglycinamidine synthase subunit PurQ [Candidatus Woesearchaeota archaeon]